MTVHISDSEDDDEFVSDEEHVGQENIFIFHFVFSFKVAQCLNSGIELGKKFA